MRRFGLSKSKLAAFEQCPKKLWLQVHRPEEAVTDDALQALFNTGHAVGELACKSYPNGIMIEADPDINSAVVRTSELIQLRPARPLFEATFRYEQVLVRVDIMRPADNGAWHVAEVKSSSGPKDYQLGDLATQIWVMQGCRVNIASASIRHIDSSFVYQGNGDYTALLKDAPADDLIAPLIETRPEIAREALATLEGDEPKRETGAHCNKPFCCQFQDYCNRGRSQPAWPISLLPNSGARLAEKFGEKGIVELLDIAELELKAELHRRIHRVTTTGEPFHDCAAALEATKHWAWPLSYLDFETIAFAIPRWKGTRPFEQVPFQFSLHVERDDRRIEHRGFLDLSGDDPRRACAEALVSMVPDAGSVVTYNASFERRCVRRLVELYPDLASALFSIERRIVDLLPIARACWYHRDQRGSWSIKQLLPTIAPHLDYASLEVGDGGAAQTAYLEAIDPETADARRAELARALKRYCALDTEAMIVVYHRLVGHSAAPDRPT